MQFLLRVVLELHADFWSISTVYARPVLGWMHVERPTWMWGPSPYLCMFSVLGWTP